MSIALYVQDRSGDYNSEFTLPNHRVARLAIEYIKSSGGYWYNGTLRYTLLGDIVWDEYSDVFIPWHRIEYLQILGTETPEQGRE